MPVYRIQAPLPPEVDAEPYLEDVTFRCSKRFVSVLQERVTEDETGRMARLTVFIPDPRWPQVRANKQAARGPRTLTAYLTERTQHEWSLTPWPAPSSSASPAPSERTRSTTCPTPNRTNSSSKRDAA